MGCSQLGSAGIISAPELEHYRWLARSVSSRLCLREHESRGMLIRKRRKASWGTRESVRANSALEVRRLDSPWSAAFAETLDYQHAKRLKETIGTVKIPRKGNQWLDTILVRFMIIEKAWMRSEVVFLANRNSGPGIGWAICHQQPTRTSLYILFCGNPLTNCLLGTSSLKSQESL